MNKKTARRIMVIVRANDSGVWHGTLSSKTSTEIVLTKARRLWSWEGALSCSEIAISGITGGRISPPVSVTLRRNDCIEIIPTDKNL